MRKQQSPLGWEGGSKGGTSDGTRDFFFQDTSDR